MSKQIEALKLALEALEVATTPLAKDRQEVLRAQAAIREALAEPPCKTGSQCTSKCPQCEQTAQQEPVAWMWKDGTVTTDPDRADGTWTPLYTSPPASKPLTDAQIGAVAADIWGSVLIAPQSYQAFARAIEAAHGIKE